MLRAYTVLPVTAAAGLIAGTGLPSFLSAALAAAAAAWFARCRQPADLCFVNLDPHAPDTAIVPGALRQTLDRAVKSGRCIWLRLAGLPPGTRTACRLLLNREGDIEIDGPLRRTVSLQRPGVWLPDHPLPLPLPLTSSLTLVFEPCGTDRVRVSLPPAATFRPAHWALLTLLAAGACALDTGWLLAAALGFAFQSYLLEQQANRAPDDPQVRRR